MFDFTRHIFPGTSASAIFSISIYWKIHKSYIPIEYKNINFRKLTTGVSSYSRGLRISRTSDMNTDKVSNSLANWTTS